MSRQLGNNEQSLPTEDTQGPSTASVCAHTQNREGTVTSLSQKELAAQILPDDPMCFKAKGLQWESIGRRADSPLSWRLGRTKQLLPAW